MERSARIYNCARCHCQVIVCSCCDRGNIYCSQACSSASRKESMQAASKRYQKTYAGRMKHAERQKRYRNKTVTHHSSKEDPTNVLLPPVTNKVLKIIHSNKLRCHFCGSNCNRLLRTAPLDREKITAHGVWPLGP